MADVIHIKNKQSINEVVIHQVDFTNKLRAGVTVDSATATHIPPHGTPTTPSVGAISNNIVPILFGAVGITGRHRVRVLGTLSTGEEYEVMLIIKVTF